MLLVIHITNSAPATRQETRRSVARFIIQYYVRSGSKKKYLNLTILREGLNLDVKSLVTVRDRGQYTALLTTEKKHVHAVVFNAVKPSAYNKYDRKGLQMECEENDNIQMFVDCGSEDDKDKFSELLRMITQIREKKDPKTLVCDWTLEKWQAKCEREASIAERLEAMRVAAMHDNAHPPLGGDAIPEEADDAMPVDEAPAPVDATGALEEVVPAAQWNAERQALERDIDERDSALYAMQTELDKLRDVKSQLETRDLTLAEVRAQLAARDEEARELAVLLSVRNGSIARLQGMVAQRDRTIKYIEEERKGLGVGNA